MIEGIVPRKPRPPTAHQIAVERNRSQRVEHILDRGIRKRHKKSRRLRKTDGAVIRAAKRVRQMEDPFEDSEGDENVSAMKHHLLVGPSAFAPGVDPVTAKKTPFRERGLGGLVSLITEQDDFGEEMVAYSAAFRRATRRLDRWERQIGTDVGPVAPIKKARPEAANDGRDPDETEEELDATGFDGSLLAAPRGLSRSKSNGVPASSNGDVAMEDAEDLNEEDKELLGIASDREDGDGEGDAEDEELDDIELTMLGRKDVSDSE